MLKEEENASSVGRDDIVVTRQVLRWSERLHRNVIPNARLRTKPTTAFDQTTSTQLHLTLAPAFQLHHHILL